jgi:hypothetical protein
MTSSGQESPQVVDEHEWRTAHQALLAKEKALTHARDDLAAQRRRLPMVRVAKEYSFDGAVGPVTLLDLFDGRPQLLLYHFMFAPAVHGWPTAGCPGCSMFIDNIGQFSTWPQRVFTPGRRDLSYLLYNGPRFGDGGWNLVIARPDSFRAPGAVGGFSARFAAVATVSVVASPRRIRTTQLLRVDKRRDQPTYRRFD